MVKKFLSFLLYTSFYIDTNEQLAIGTEVV